MSATPKRLIIVIVFISSMIALSSLTAAQIQMPAEALATQFVTMLDIEAQSEDDDFGKTSTQSFGTGLIIGARKNILYIVTQAHLFPEYDGMGNLCQNGNYRVMVTFKDVSGRPITMPGGQALKIDRRKHVDLALIRIPLRNGDPMPIREPDFNMLAPPGTLKEGQLVMMIGYPGHRSWFKPPNPFEIYRIIDSTEEIEFKTSVIPHGYSGSPLFNKCWQILGLFRREGTPVSVAYSSNWLISRLKEWQQEIRFPILLRSSPPCLQSMPTPRRKTYTGLGVASISYQCDTQKEARCPPPAELKYRALKVAEARALSNIAQRMGINVNSLAAYHDGHLNKEDIVTSSGRYLRTFEISEPVIDGDQIQVKATASLEH